MKKTQQILYLLVGIYCILPFIISFFIVIPLYFLIFNFAGKKAPVMAHRISRGWGYFLLTAFFLRVKIKNREFIDSATTYVFIANHRSMLDIPLYAISCKNTFRFLSKAELAKIPIFGYVVKRLYITVNRSDKSDRGRSIEKMQRSLAEGVSIFLAPEGTRNRTTAPLLPFKDGAFLLAVTSGRPIAVLTILNTHQHHSPILPLELKPGILFAEWSEPILTIGLTEKDIPALKEKVRQQMYAILPR